jgi:hypothetical protein
VDAREDDHRKTFCFKKTVAKLFEMAIGCPTHVFLMARNRRRSKCLRRGMTRKADSAEASAEAVPSILQNGADFTNWLTDGNRRNTDRQQETNIPRGSHGKYPFESGHLTRSRNSSETDDLQSNRVNRSDPQTR